MKTINVPQGSPEWLAARLGVVTASRFADATKTTKAGRAQVATDYALALAYERVFGVAAEVPFVNGAMKRGSELEPIARAWYEARMGKLVDEAGFMLTDCGRFGYSPDGLVGTDGLVEIKCPAGRQFADVIVNDDPADYMHQMQGGMWITGRAWCDIIVFTDATGGAGYIHRIYRDEQFIASLAGNLAAFNAAVDVYAKTLKTKTK